MNRPRFLKHLAGLGLVALGACQAPGSKQKLLASSGPFDDPVPDSMNLLRQQLTEAWRRSETMTMTNIKQMPPDFFTFKYTPEAMSFGEQWRHCVIYTCGQLAGRAGLDNPYENVKLPVQMTKDHVIREMENL